MLHSRKSFLQLLGLASISPQFLGAQTNAPPTDEAEALAYVRRVNTAQVTYGSIHHGLYTDRIDELSSVARLPETPSGWRLTIAVHDNKWDVVLVQENMDAIIFVTDQTGIIRRGVISPIRPLHNPPAPPSE